jgi:hypothetical protein
VWLIKSLLLVVQLLLDILLLLHVLLLLLLAEHRDQLVVVLERVLKRVHVVGGTVELEVTRFVDASDLLLLLLLEGHLLLLLLVVVLLLLLKSNLLVSNSQLVHLSHLVLVELLLSLVFIVHTPKASRASASDLRLEELLLLRVMVRETGVSHSLLDPVVSVVSIYSVGVQLLEVLDVLVLGEVA